VLNHLEILDCAEPEISAWQPETTLGRDPPPNEFVRFDAVVKCNGKPLWKVPIPLMPQPEMSFSAIPLAPPKSSSSADPKLKDIAHYNAVSYVEARK